MIQRLVVNGCSYMFNYTGQIDLAQQLNIKETKNISVPGSCNFRIIRTVLQDSYSNSPTLYIVGLTFLTRHELPIREGSHTFEGKWVSVTAQGSLNEHNLDKHFTENDIEIYNSLHDKFTTLALPDLAYDLQFRLLSLIESLQSRNHQILIFNTAESAYSYFLSDSKFDPLRNTPNIIQGLKWQSIPWQFEQGASYPPEDEKYPPNYRHVSPGDHLWLNEFLTNYIKEHKILK